MAKRDALNTPFDGAQPTPDMSGTLAGTTGGFAITTPGVSGGLSQVAFDSPWCPTPGGSETPNSSGLPLQITTIGVPDGPSVGENIPDSGVAGTPMPKITGI
jgi:hypothetical protein